MTNSPISDAIAELAGKLSPVPTEELSIGNTLGRILAEPLTADRDSPALSVSAMDGYAIRLADIANEELPVKLPIQETTPAGSPPSKLEPHQTIQVFTGAPAPAGCDAVIKREDTTESAEAIEFDPTKVALTSNLHIRSQGENIRSGAEILPAGTPINCATMAAVASFGKPKLLTRRRVRVAILNTGDELTQPGDPVEPWQIRDSNGPVLNAWLNGKKWIEIVQSRHVGDTLASVQQAIRNVLEQCDAIILTGGVSMGDTDYVPQAVEDIGGNIIFHRLPLRPGKPVLGAEIEGKLILGLPGNPVSVAVTSRVFGNPLLNKLAASRCTGQPSILVGPTNDEALSKSLHLTWYRPVQVLSDGSMQYVKTKGSGDLVSLSQSQGFVEVPPNSTGPGPWRYTSWED